MLSVDRLCVNFYFFCMGIRCGPTLHFVIIIHIIISFCYYFRGHTIYVVSTQGLKRGSVFKPRILCMPWPPTLYIINNTLAMYAG